MERLLLPLGQIVKYFLILISFYRDSFTDKEDGGHTAYVKSASGPICPFGNKVSHSERFGNGWKFWNGEEWEVDETLLSQCIKY